MVAVDAELTAALDPILADLAGEANVVPEIRESNWAGPQSLCADLSFDGAGVVGIMTTKGATHSTQVADLADQIQDWAVDVLFSARRSPVWPRCPEHPDSHPLKPTESDGRAAWVCPVSSKVVAQIGLLTA